MNTIIIDDDAIARAVLKRLCAQTEELNLVGSFENAMEAMKFLNENKVELIYLDVHMPHFSGFDLVKTIQGNVPIVLTTSDSTKAMEAFEFDCIVDYLVKPLQVDRFLKSIEKAKQFSPKVNSEPTEEPSTAVSDDFFINIDRTLIKVDAKKVNIIEADGDYIKIATEDQEYRVHTTLKKISSKLNKMDFMNVHRSYVINVAKIIDIQDNTIVIGDHVIPISRSKRPELMKRLNLL